ncbi:fibronectin type III domain-containing protein [Isoptericola dokdonensis]|uniref:Calcineurin-like phosphoesterase n=1 Tax=Isoptericola dokdonensis DS-3 TaxID=1300344 RepID=A0A161IF49_9MICO|nr:fibronectin type III domain-containing protein [Isoptericola dokdonensis]ANC32017.1 Calcineurin-like phosphoesterase [Isoptericola dokdonensis DS-3]
MTNPKSRWGRRAAVGMTLTGLVAGALAAPAAAAPDVPEAPVVDASTTWRYLDDGADPAQGDPDLRVWTTTGFDDSAWKAATGSFGAKRGKLDPVGPRQPRTLLNQYLDGSAAPNVPTFFFRTDFTLDAGVADQVADVVGDLVYDDGAVVWINGERVAGFHADRVTDDTNLQYAGSGLDAPTAASFTADGDVLVDGVNTVAVALYQDRSTSSDIYLDVPSIRLVEELAPGVVDPTPPSRVILTPTETPETSQSFSWLAGHTSQTTGQVQIRPAAGGDVRTVDAYAAGAVNGNPLQHYSTTVDGLSAATAYTYRVGTVGAWSPWHEFTTADPSDTDFQFVYYGDAQIGLDSTWPKVVEMAEASAPDSIGSVHAGDLIDTGGNETQWVSWFTGMETSAATTNVMAAPGNHEYSGDKLLTAWKANFEYPHNNPTTDTIGDLADLAVGDTDVAKQYAAYFEHWSQFAAETVYFTDYQGVRFITINATRDTTFLTPDSLPACTGTDCPSGKVSALWTQFQAEWLDHVLTQTPSKWNVVTFHQPVYSTSAGRNEPILREHWVPVFQEHDIDLVMMGHDHTYARGYNDEDVTDTPGVTDGPVYIVSNSGAKHYALETDERNVWTNNGATQVLRGAGVTTYQVIDVTGDSLHYRSYLAEKTASATTDLPVGAVYDEFTVTKSDDGEKWVTEAGVEPPVTEPDTTRPEVTLVAPTSPGPVRELAVQVDATDDRGLAKVVANVYSGGKLVKSTQSAVADGAKVATHTATVALPSGAYTVRYNAHDLAGNVSRTSTFDVTVDATAPTATVKEGASFTTRTGDVYGQVSFKLHDAGKVDKVVLNGVPKDLSDNAWSDVNFVRPGVFGAKAGANTLVVHDVAGNTRTYEFTLG